MSQKNRKENQRIKLIQFPKNKATKCLYTVSMICQITSRLITFCVFGLLFFDKDGFALAWMMLACFIHVGLVFLYRAILWCTDKVKDQRKFDFFYLLSGSFLSVFTFVKGRQTSEDKSDDNNKRESQRSKLLSRILFLLIVLIEQGLLYGGIVHACTSVHQKIDLDWKSFLISMTSVLVIGISLESLAKFRYLIRTVS